MRIGCTLNTILLRLVDHVVYSLQRAAPQLRGVVTAQRKGWIGIDINNMYTIVISLNIHSFIHSLMHSFTNTHPSIHPPIHHPPWSPSSNVLIRNTFIHSMQLLPTSKHDKHPLLFRTRNKRFRKDTTCV